MPLLNGSYSSGLSSTPTKSQVPASSQIGYFNPSNVGYMQPSQPQNQNISTANQYAGGITMTPQNQNASFNQNLSAPAPYAGGMKMTSPSTAQNQNVSTPPPYAGGAQMSSGSSQGQPAGFNTQYATWDNIQPYMNPYLDNIIAKGNNAIQGSAANRGLLGSSGTFNNIGDWTAGATQKAYQDATTNFNNDRDYMTGNYWKTDAANRSDYQYENNFRSGLYQDQFNAYNNMMSGNSNQQQFLSKYGPEAAGEISRIAQATGASEAEIYNMMGLITGQQQANQGSNNQGLLSGISGALPGLISLLAGA